METVHLLNCPFCKGQAAVKTTKAAYGAKPVIMIKCLFCKCQTAARTILADAVELWNTRA